MVLTWIGNIQHNEKTRHLLINIALDTLLCKEFNSGFKTEVRAIGTQNLLLTAAVKAEYAKINTIYETGLIWIPYI